MIPSPLQSSSPPPPPPPSLSRRLPLIEAKRMYSSLQTLARIREIRKHRPLSNQLNYHLPALGA